MNTGQEDICCKSISVAVKKKKVSNIIIVVSQR